ncbi:hypothetical protein EIN_186520 [Entamoeba invadens IP1]|uniref:hypothetical protein n=1 Tax=Entamoeba invadens IP1 TaxID=370355 RepID=UPI0002C3DDE7|nr:hypothetical protein EIN_186520 [Entamoeba invadens IP1]ELP94225.1 hypothetical protein EIN_186520 [Entamoeba invadens IP1]|eukprot:XP_004260996.1 hypothetical protein EIN_186520 [Entamoeba invadens IP1]
MALLNAGPIFGQELSVVMSYQSKEYPSLSIPLIYVLMHDTLQNMQCETHEGIFRVPGKQEEVECYKDLFDKGQYQIYKDCSCNTIAGLFKLFLRELPTPIIPTNCYDFFVSEEVVSDISNNPDNIKELLNKLPSVNKEMVIYIISFLQELSAHFEETKMGVDNLAMVFSACMLIGDASDPFLALTKTNLAQSCIAALIANFPKDMITTVNLDVTGYDKKGFALLEVDPVIAYMEEKEREKEKLKEKKGIFVRSRAQSTKQQQTPYKEKRTSLHHKKNETNIFKNSKGDYALVSALAQSLSDEKETKTPKRVTSMNIPKNRVIDVLQANSMWDLEMAPLPLKCPAFNIKEKIQV